VTSAPRVSVIGLGYVGLPLAVALARRFEVIGFDASPVRIGELRCGFDRTREVEPEALKASRVELAAEPAAIGRATLHIITVPTPVDAANRPDLSAVLAACATVGAQLKRGDVVVLESTVWPGVTEEICGPALGRASGLAPGRDFFLGYSPERVNPGDRVHRLEKIAKVIAGQTPEVVELLRTVYGAITDGGVFVARNIMTAEAAKAIENAQRDINIAFVNEIAMIFQKLGLSTRDVLDAAATKWNFVRFEPGLVGGHCIGVDPYYLAHRAETLGHHPEIILAGRRINDRMAIFVADCIADRLAAQAKTRRAPVLVLGLTFKENVPDLRNSQVPSLVHRLMTRGHAVEVHDPLADADEARRHYGLRLLPSLEGKRGYGCVVGAVAHEAYRAFAEEGIEGLLKPGGLVADIRGMWRGLELSADYGRWEL